MKRGSVRDDFQQTVRTTLAVTTAFSWLLVILSISHARFGINPLDGGGVWKLSFPMQGAPQEALTVLIEWVLYLVALQVLSRYMYRQLPPKLWLLPLSIETVNSFLFSMKLQSYMAWEIWARQPIPLFTVNFVVTFCAAAVAHLVETRPTQPESSEDDAVLGSDSVSFISSAVTTAISSVGFGLGVHWNLLVGSLMPSTDRYNLAVTLRFCVLVIVVQAYYTQHAHDPLVPTPSERASVRRSYSSYMCFIGAVVLAFATSDWLVALGVAPPINEFRPLHSLVIVLTLIGLAVYAANIKNQLDADLERRGWHTLRGGTIVHDPSSPGELAIRASAAVLQDGHTLTRGLLSTEGDAVNTVFEDALELNLWWKRARLCQDVLALCASLVMNNFLTSALDSTLKFTGCTCCSAAQCPINRFLTASVVMAVMVSAAAVAIGNYLGITVDVALNGREPIKSSGEATP